MRLASSRVGRLRQRHAEGERASRSKPGSTCRSRLKLRISRPDPASSTIASAIWPTTSPPRRPGRPPVRMPRLPWRSDCACALRLIRIAGSAPNARLVSSESAAAKASTPLSTRTSARRGTPCGWSASKAVHQHPREQDPGDAAREGQQQALREELAHDAALPGAERRAQRELALAAGDAREQQVRDVDARHEQHQAHRAEQHEQGPARVADRRLVQRAHHAADALVGVGVGLLEPARDRRAPPARALATDAPGAEPRHDGEVPGAAAVGAEALVVASCGSPDLGALGIAEARAVRCRPPSAGSRSICTRPAHDPGVAAEAVAPQLVAEHDHLRARLVLARDEAAAEDRAGRAARRRTAALTSAPSSRAAAPVAGERDAAACR